MGLLLKSWSGLPALTAALLSVGLAAAWFWWVPGLVVPLVLVIALVGLLTYLAGWSQVRRDPERAVRLMEWWLLVQLVGIAVVGAGAIWLAVVLDPGNDASVETKKVLGALGGAIAAFLAATWIKSAEDADKNWLSGRIGTRFSSEFRGVFKKETDGELAVYSSVGYGDWTYDDRRQRAAAISEALQDPSQLQGES